MTTNSISLYRQPNKTIPKIISLTEYAFCYIAIIYFSSVYGSIVTYFAGQSANFQISSLLRYLVILVSFCLIVCRWKLSLSVAKRGILLWVFIGWTVLSMLWSETPEGTYLSIRGLLLPVVLFAIYFSSRFSLKEQIKILTIFFFIASLLSIATVFAIPQVGRHPITEFDGAWRGLFGHKNGLSGFMTLTLVLFLCSLLGNEPESEKNFPQQFSWIGIVLIEAMILASTSKTGLFLSLFMIIFLLFYKQFRWYGTRSMLMLSSLIIIVLTAGTMLSSNWEPILAGIGRDPTLTGRTNIWQGAVEYWFDKFWAGYGLDAFWDQTLPYSETLGMAVTGVRRITYMVPNSHNGFLDTALALGFIGLTLFLVTLFLGYKRAFRSAYLLPHSHLLFAASFMVFYTFLNCVESLILNRVGFFFMLYMTVYLSLLCPEREIGSYERDDYS
jgi:exopolysaccharide production protein ExoQ